MLRRSAVSQLDEIKVGHQPNIQHLKQLLGSIKGYRANQAKRNFKISLGFWLAANTFMWSVFLYYDEKNMLSARSMPGLEGATCFDLLQETHTLGWWANPNISSACRSLSTVNSKRFIRNVMVGIFDLISLGLITHFYLKEKKLDPGEIRLNYFEAEFRKKIFSMFYAVGITIKPQMSINDLLDLCDSRLLDNSKPRIILVNNSNLKGVGVFDRISQDLLTELLSTFNIRDLNHLSQSSKYFYKKFISILDNPILLKKLIINNERLLANYFKNSYEYIVVGSPNNLVLKDELSCEALKNTLSCLPVAASLEKIQQRAYFQNAHDRHVFQNIPIELAKSNFTNKCTKWTPIVCLLSIIAVIISLRSGYFLSNDSDSQKAHRSNINLFLALLTTTGLMIFMLRESNNQVRDGVLNNNAMFNLFQRRLVNTEENKQNRNFVFKL